MHEKFLCSCRHPCTSEFLHVVSSKHHLGIIASAYASVNQTYEVDLHHKRSVLSLAIVCDNLQCLFLIDDNETFSMPTCLPRMKIILA